VSPTIPEAELQILSRLQNDVVLAIIMQEGRIRFQVADWNIYPGHLEWLRRDGIRQSQVAGGFSLLVKSGRVRYLFALSRLNDPHAPALTDEQIVNIAAQLPLDLDFRVLK
jgi:hypothetical protein